MGCTGKNCTTFACKSCLYILSASSSHQQRPFSSLIPPWHLPIFHWLLCLPICHHYVSILFLFKDKNQLTSACLFIVSMRLRTQVISESIFKNRPAPVTAATGYPQGFMGNQQQQPQPQQQQLYVPSPLGMRMAPNGTFMPTSSSPNPMAPTTMTYTHVPSPLGTSPVIGSEYPSTNGMHTRTHNDG